MPAEPNKQTNESLATRLRTIPNTLPVQLEQVPLVQAIFEVRFQLQKDSISLFPSLVLKELGNEYGRSEVSAIASIPREIRENDPNLRYQPQYVFRGEAGASVSIGERVASVIVLAPYEGWSNFRLRINNFVSVLQDSQFVQRVERFSLKFLNLLEAPENQQLNLIHLTAQLGGMKVPERGFRLRTEVTDDKALRIVEIVTNAEATVPGVGKKTGLLVSLDCIKELTNDDFWSTRDERIEEVHWDLKQLFFGIIKEETLVRLRPIYGNDARH